MPRVEGAAPPYKNYIGSEKSLDNDDHVLFC
jgi:hypothetical protein